MPKIWTPAHGRNVARLRQKLGKSQESLAGLIGAKKVTVDSIKHWESGAHKPSPTHLEDLARVLGTNVPDLLAPPAEKPMFPPFGAYGVSIFRALPALHRATVADVICEALKAEGFDHYSEEGFGMSQLWSYLEERVGLPSAEPEQKKIIMIENWAKSGRRAFVLSGFRSSAQSEWEKYAQLIRQLRRYCHFVIVQSIDPIHTELEAGSSYERKSLPDHSVGIQQDVITVAKDTCDELPPCCIQSIKSLLESKNGFISAKCVAELVATGLFTNLGAPRVQTKWVTPLKRALGIAT